jgi:pimeloyl-ACP methyl ester carboxylesterase
MPAVFVHGVPETPALWQGVLAALGRTDVLTPALPGFGNPRPEGFAATKEAYADWLVGQLEAVGEPVDLVGHDWGGGLVVRAVSTRPDLVRSWVTDAAAVGDVEGFEWHDFAKLWQTPGAGEEFWQQSLAGTVEERAGLLAAGGVPASFAPTMAAGIDETMAACILDLYRSAVDVGREWGADFADVAAPGLVVIPSGDAFLAATSAERAAERAGAQVARLDGAGHWWMLEDPARAAAVFTEFWASV